MAGSSKKSDTKSEAAAPAVIKATKSLRNSMRDQDSKTKVNLKKPKKVVIAPFEKKKITKGFVWKNFEKKEMIKEFADRLQRLEAKVDLLVTKAHLLATKADIQELFIPAKGEKVPAMKPLAKAASDSDDSYMDTSSEDESSSAEAPANKPAASAAKPAANNSFFSVGGNGQSFSVTGFDSSLPVDDIKSALSIYFSYFGKITRVFVPPSHGTGGSLGYAYIDLIEGANKALKLGTHVVGGWDLVVGKAEPIRSGSTWPFPGRCGNQGRCTFC
ncbi:RNA-binding domain superfamily [Arabidopsis thaliana x Arabidopsis arenosa]|uniref:RNA-binding domain superfamily n=1 Tax=Arabidopsis thaliana x Arabidopsis arenosa TaxID=1240361 RepID=A0A8T2BP77_9BRAS|nr:RNA-binding domain superfamily [Arabidopsis thaliana x Arabidopsis arenosa]